MPDIKITNFKGVYNKASIHDQPDVFAVSCRDLVTTYDGKLVRRYGTRTAYLDSVQFVTTGLTGNIIALFELQTGRPSPDDVKYLCMTDDSTGKLYVWTPGTPTWIRIDNSLTDFRDAAGTVQPCRFLAEDGNVRVLVGGTSANKPLWWGYCGERFTNAISDTSGTNAKIAAAFKTTASLSNVSAVTGSSYIDVTQCDPGSGVTWDQSINESFTDGLAHYVVYHYYISLQYDWKQWSPLSKADIDLTVSLAPTLSTSDQARGAVLVTLPAALDTRITGVRIYRSRVLDSSILEGVSGVPYLLYEAGLNDSIPTISSGDTQRNWPIENRTWPATYDSGTKTFTLVGTAATDDALADDMLNGGMLVVADALTGTITYKYCLVTDTVFTSTSAQTIVVADGTGLVHGSTYYLYCVRSWYKSGTDYKLLVLDSVSQDSIAASPQADLLNDQATVVYPKYATMLNGQAFYASCYHYGETKAHLVTYGYLTSEGNFANDVAAVLNAFTQGVPLNGISSIADRLILYSPNAIFRGVIPSSNESTWQLEREFDGFGLLAENSLVSINGRNYFLASDWDVKEYDGATRPRSIGNAIYDRLQTAGTASIAYLQGAIGFYLAKLKMYMLKFQTGASTYEYWGLDLSQPDNPAWVQFAWKDTGDVDANFNGFVTSADGSTYAFTSTTVRSLHDPSQTTDNNVTYTPLYKTLPLFVDKKLRHHLRQIAITYRSDTVVDFDVYLNGSNTPITQVSNELPVKNTLGVQRKNLPLGTICDYFQIGITLGASEAPQNSILELDELNIQLEVSGGDV